MKVKLLQGDITTLCVDAIVNAANNSLLGGGGVDGAIHAAAGRRLLEECRGLNGCQTGEAKITKGNDLPAKYVIHTVGPIWRGGNAGEKGLLESCYRNSMELAKQSGVKSIAFPLLSAGIFGYPKREAIAVAITTLKQYEDSDIEIYLILYDSETYSLASRVTSNIIKGENK